MDRREIIKLVSDGKEPPYVPWSFIFTKEPADILKSYYKTEDLDNILYNHILMLGSDIGLFDDLIEIGVDCFNPFQTEVMDVHALLKKYSGRRYFSGKYSHFY